jgi:hypothetical protein
VVRSIAEDITKYMWQKLKVEKPNILTNIVMTFLVQECYGSPKKHENSLKFVKIRENLLKFAPKNVLTRCFIRILQEF